MVAIDNAGTSFGNIIFIDDLDFPKEESGSIDTIGFDGKVGSHV